MPRKVSFLVAQIVKPGPFQSKSSGNLFINIGTQTALVNNTPLVTGASLSLGVNTDELDVTNYQITFEGGGTPLLSVWQKVYVDQKLNR